MCIQEAQLPRTDRATRYVCRNIVSYLLHGCSNKLHNRSKTNRSDRVIGLQSADVYSKQPRRINRRRCGKQSRLSRSFVDNTIDLPGEIL